MAGEGDERLATCRRTVTEFAESLSGDINEVIRSARYVALAASVLRSAEDAELLDRAARRVIGGLPTPTRFDWWLEFVWSWPGLPRLAFEAEGGSAAILRRIMAGFVPAVGSPSSGVRKDVQTEPWGDLRRLALRWPAS